MPSRYEIQNLVYEALKHDPDFRARAFDALVAMDNGDYVRVNYDDGGVHDIPWTDICLQTGRPRQSLRLEDRVVAAMLMTAVNDGRIGYAFLQAPGPALPDKDVDGNHRLLQTLVKTHQELGVHHLLSASFHGGKDGEDGHIEFATPFVCHQQDGAHVPGQATLFPLEVGACLPDQVWGHLRSAHSIARLPYGHDVIVFLELAPGVHPEDLMKRPHPRPSTDVSESSTPTKAGQARRVKPAWRAHEEALIAGGASEEDLQRMAVDCFSGRGDD